MAHSSPPAFPHIRPTRACLLLALCALLSCLGEAADRPFLWAGQPVSAEGWTHGGAHYLGWLWMGPAGDSAWVYALALESYAYAPESGVTSSGAWTYLPDLDSLAFNPSLTGEGWQSSGALDTLVYPAGSPSQTGPGWVYILNTGNPMDRLPADIAVAALHTADPEASDPDRRYRDAFHLGVEDLLPLAEWDPLIMVSRSPKGLTFTNTAFRGNGYIRLGFRPDRGGLLDFGALGEVSGTAYAVARVNLNLSQTTNGFYVRLKDDAGDVGTHQRVDGGIVADDLLFTSSLTNPAAGAYLEITLPWQGEATVQDVYLHMEDTVTGFAGMAEQITGGEGATEAHTFTVESADELEAALEAVRDLEAPSIIQVAGPITWEAWSTATGNDARQIKIGADVRNLSLLGLNQQAIFDGIGFDVQGRNLLFQNLTIRYVLGRDGITLNNATFVRVDHCRLYNEPMDQNPDKDKYDELLSIKNNAHSVILSWNHFHDSHKTILVGSNDAIDAIPDRKLIMHHNWFQDCGSRLPLYRGGYAHLYNNFFERAGTAINVRTLSQMRIEKNYFKEVGGAIGYWFDTTNPSGKWEVSGNIFEEVNGNKPTVSTTVLTFAGNYQYALDPAESLPLLVPAEAGPRFSSP